MMKTIRSIFFSRNTLISLGMMIFLMVMFIPHQAVQATGNVLYVAPESTGYGSCSSWANACTLQYALSYRAYSGDEIWVKKGVHYPGPAGSRTSTFTLKNGVAIYGGFDGTETRREDRDWQSNITVLSGDIDQNDITDPNGVVTKAANIGGENAYHVVTASGTNSTAVLDGFVITAGRANGGYENNYGGGMYNSNSNNPTLINIIFSGNFASFYGGGMYNSSSSPKLTNVEFNSNSGSGMYNYGGNPTLTNVEFNNNSGSGMYNYYSSPTLTNVEFNNNSGSGMYNSSSSPTLTNVVFNNNRATNGGGMYNDSSSNPTLINAAFIGNKADNYGGGMYNDGSPKLTNVVFSGNIASNYGGGMYNSSNINLRLTNVTMSGNSAQYGGGMYNNSIHSVTIRNILLWGDNATNGSEIYNFQGTPPVIFYSNIRGCGGSNYWNSACGMDGGHNIDADPLFMDADGSDNVIGSIDDNLRLQLISPAIDAGDNTAVPSGIITDLDGNPRFTDISIVSDTGTGTPPIVDMGAYEAQNTYPPNVISITRTDPNPTSSATVNFNVTFTKDVTGVDSDDFSLSITGSLSGASVTEVNGSGSVYTVTVSTGTGNGTLRLDIPTSATITDLADNSLVGLPYTSGGIYDVDKTAPTVVAINRSDSNPTRASSVRFTVTFSENVTGVGTDDFSPTISGSISSAIVTSVSGSGSTYTVTVSTGTGSGTLRLDIPTSATINDLAGNSLGGLPFTSGQVYNIDKTAPTVVSINRADPNPTNATSVRFTVTFSEDVTGVDSGDFKLTTTGSLSGTSVTGVSGSLRTYTITVRTGTGSGTLRLDIPTSAIITDLLGNSLSGLPYTNGQVYDVDKTSPTVVSISRADPNPSHATSVRFTVTFSEDVTGVDIGDFSLFASGSLSGAIVTGVSGSGATRTVTVNTGSGSGSLRLDISDIASITDLLGYTLINLPYTSGEVYTIDKNAPSVVSITRLDSNPTNAASVRFNVTFSEDVTGVDSDDFSLTATGSISGVSIIGVSGSGATRTITINTGSGNGSLRLDIPDIATITDLAGNLLPGLPYTSGEDYMMDKEAPSVVSITRTDPDPTNAATVTFMVTFSEAVTGVDSNDFSPTITGSLSGANVTGVYGSDCSYTVTVNTGTGDGTLRLDISVSATISDLADNSLGELPYTSGQVYDVDKTAPMVVSISRSDPNPTRATSVRFTVTFSEDVIGVDSGDFRLTTTGNLSGASVTGVSGSRSRYIITVKTGTGSGTLRLDIPTAATITDLADNRLGELPYTSSQVYEVDKTAPTIVSITRVDTSPTNATSVRFTVTFSEDVTGVDNGDFSLSTTGNLHSVSVMNVSGSGATRTVTVNTGSDSGNLRLDIPDSAVITDLLGNPLINLPYTSGEGYTIDKDAPRVVSIMRLDSSPTNADSVRFTVTFSEDVSGVDSSDFSLNTSGDISGASISEVSGSGATRTVTVNTGSGSGSIRLDIPDTAVITDLLGNSLIDLPYNDGEIYTIDNDIQWVISITRLDMNPTNAASVRFTVTFSEDVTGVDGNDFSLNTSGDISGASISEVRGSGATRTVTVNTGSGNGTLRLDIPLTATITDLAGNSLTDLPYISGEVYTIDKTSPSVISITRLDSIQTNAASVRFTVTFSEDVIGVDSSDFNLTTTGSISGASVMSVSGSGTTRTVTINTGSGSGSLRLDIPDTASITDQAGNSLTDLPYSSGEDYTIDRDAPSVISITRLDPNPNDGGDVRFEVAFSEPVFGVGTADFSLYKNGSISGEYISGVIGSGTTYTVTVYTGTGSGNLRLDIPATADVRDGAGNSLTGLPFTDGEEYTIYYKIYLPLILNLTP